MRGTLSAQPVLGKLLDRAQLEARQQQALARVLLDVGEAAPNRTYNSNAGDERAMRGVPILGRGVTGAIAGTRPDGIAHENRPLDALLWASVNRRSIAASASCYRGRLLA